VNRIKLIVGLGNPGGKYERTRHNIGYVAVDRLLEMSPVQSERLAHEALIFESEKFGLLCKPLTFMNRSGRALLGIVREYSLQPQEVLVLYDDFALALGWIRVRARGSSGGHNGLQSIIDHLGTTEIPRVRMGIKTDEMESWVDFVLANFKRSERKVVEEMLEQSCDAVEVILQHGVTTAMNRFNKKQKLEDGPESD
jgi:PTH1 family peptidyl-tRNA hydrolase